MIIGQDMLVQPLQVRKYRRIARPREARGRADKRAPHWRQTDAHLTLMRRRSAPASQGAECCKPGSASQLWRASDPESARVERSWVVVGGLPGDTDWGSPTLEASNQIDLCA